VPYCQFAVFNFAQSPGSFARHRRRWTVPDYPQWSGGSRRPGTAPNMVVVANWFEELKRLMPAY
jgi:hypothetical protein